MKKKQFYVIGEFVSYEKKEPNEQGQIEHTIGFPRKLTVGYYSIEELKELETKKEKNDLGDRYEHVSHGVVRGWLISSIIKKNELPELTQQVIEEVMAGDQRALVYYNNAEIPFPDKQWELGNESYLYELEIESLRFAKELSDFGLDNDAWNYRKTLEDKIQIHTDNIKKIQSKYYWLLTLDKHPLAEEILAK